MSYGIIGLIDAIEKCDNARATKFETYACIRIRGAILDGARSIDWVPRSVRANMRSVVQAYTKLGAEQVRGPSDAAVAEELGITEDELRKIFYQISFTGLISLDDVLPCGQGPGGDTKTVLDVIPDRRAGPEAAFGINEMRQLLAAAINDLADREKIVLTLHYYEGLTLAQIGHVLGVTASRVCQIHTSAVRCLRSALNPLLEISA